MNTPDRTVETHEMREGQVALEDDAAPQSEVVCWGL